MKNHGKLSITYSYINQNHFTIHTSNEISPTVTCSKDLIRRRRRRKKKEKGICKKKEGQDVNNKETRYSFLFPSFHIKYQISTCTKYATENKNNTIPFPLFPPSFHFRVPFVEKLNFGNFGVCHD